MSSVEHLDDLIARLERAAEQLRSGELSPAEAVTFFRDVLAPLVRQYGWLAMWIVRNVDKIDIDNPVEAAQGRPVFELRRGPSAVGGV